MGRSRMAFKRLLALAVGQVPYLDGAIPWAHAAGVPTGMEGVGKRCVTKSSQMMAAMADRNSALPAETAFLSQS